MTINLQRLKLPDSALHTRLGKLIESWKHHYKADNDNDSEKCLIAIMKLLKEYGVLRLVDNSIELFKLKNWESIIATEEEIIEYAYTILIEFDSKLRLEKIMESKKINIENIIKTSDKELLGFQDKLYNDARSK